MSARGRAFFFIAATMLLLAGLIEGRALATDRKKRPAPAPASMPQVQFVPTEGFRIKPSDVAIPSGVPIGQYRRVTRPYPNWTLICDENLQKKQKVCNISQSILGSDGGTVFSWSLAASQEGQPFFILRVPPAVGAAGSIQLELGDRDSAIIAPVKGCEPTVCIAYQPISARLRDAIEKGLSVQISYVGGSPAQTVSFRAPFAGLNNALSGI